MSSSSVVVLSEFPSDVSLPSDIFLDVLIRLPFEDLITNKEKLKYVMRLRCVCRFFLNLINNPTFISYYRSHLYDEYDDYFEFNFMDTTTSTNLYSCLLPSSPPGRLPWRFHISFKGSNFIYLQKRHELIPFHCPNHKRLIGSINGLVCFGGIYSLEIYNIFAGTKCYLSSPTTKTTHEIDSKPNQNPIFVIGYDPLYKDYQILRFRNQAIYSFKMGLWKLGDGYSTCRSHRYGNSLEGRSVCINGVIYWPPGKRHVTTGSYYIWTGIVSFDLCKEKFKEIKLPGEDLVLPSRYADIQLLSFKGCLAFALLGMKKARKGKGEIWVVLFKSKSLHINGGGGGEDCLWIKESFVVPILSEPQKEAEIVLCCDEIFLGWFECKQLRLYNLHTKDFINLPLSPPSHYYPKVSVGKKMKDPTYVDNVRFDFSLV